MGTQSCHWQFHPHHQYSPVTVSVDAPQLHVGLGSDSGRPRGAVDQGQLSEAASFSNAGHPFVVHIHLEEEEMMGKRCFKQSEKSHIFNAVVENQTLTSISPWSMT